MHFGCLFIVKIFHELNFKRNDNNKPIQTEPNKVKMDKTACLCVSIFPFNQIFVVTFKRIEIKSLYSQQ